MYSSTFLAKLPVFVKVTLVWSPPTSWPLTFAHVSSTAVHRVVKTLQPWTILPSPLGISGSPAAGQFALISACCRELPWPPRWQEQSRSVSWGKACRHSHRGTVRSGGVTFLPLPVSCSFFSPAQCRSCFQAAVGDKREETQELARLYLSCEYGTAAAAGGSWREHHQDDRDWGQLPSRSRATFTRANLLLLYLTRGSKRS